jgi:hypothetical protein
MSDEFWYQKRPPIAVGNKYGKLTVTEDLGKNRCRCVCDCGAEVTRDTIALRASKVTAGIPQCKVCMRASRKKKNPGLVVNRDLLGYPDPRFS